MNSQQIINMDNVEEVNLVSFQKEAGIDKYKSTVIYIETELLNTLAYLEDQINIADEKSLGVEGFSKSVFESKKMLVEQKVSILKQLSMLAVDQIKISAKNKDEIADITCLFAK